MRDDRDVDDSKSELALLDCLRISFVCLESTVLEFIQLRHVASCAMLPLSFPSFLDSRARVLCHIS